MAPLSRPQRKFANRAIPPAFSGERIGLFGGSFDPAHWGHAHVAETALKALGLSRVWWLVSPQNPLKPRSSPFETRMASARAQAKKRRMIVSDLETRLGLRFTWQTIAALKRARPGVRFVWIMGADNLKSFSRWQRAHAITGEIPIAIVARPGAGPEARLTKPFRRGRLAPGANLPAAKPPAWLFIHAKWAHVSSTMLRAKAGR